MLYYERIMKKILLTPFVYTSVFSVYLERCFGHMVSLVTQAVYILILCLLKKKKRISWPRLYIWLSYVYKSRKCLNKNDIWNNKYIEKKTKKVGFFSFKFYFILYSLYITRPLCLLYLLHVKTDSITLSMRILYYMQLFTYVNDFRSEKGLMCHSQLPCKLTMFNHQMFFPPGTSSLASRFYTLRWSQAIVKVFSIEKNLYSVNYHIKQVEGKNKLNNMRSYI